MSGPNPLRPYYIPPPPVGFDTSPLPPPSLPPSVHNASSSFNLLTDLQDYTDYLDSPSPNEVLKNFFTQAAAQYGLNLVAQPFENSKMLLQCRVVPRRECGVVGAKGKGRKKESTWRKGRAYDSADEDNGSDDDDADSTDSEPNYFASDDITPTPKKLRRSPSRGRKMTDRAGYVVETTTDPDTAHPWQIELPHPDSSISDMLKALWAKEGAWGIWKGQNSSFLYGILERTIESWAGSFLSAVLSLPDPGLTEIADSAYPLASLGVAVAAAAISAVVLAPLDIVRTRLVITPSTEQPRNILPCLRLLPSYFIPPSLILPATLHATIPSFISLGTPYFLRTRFGCDPILTPTLFSILTFFSSTAELAVRLPLETVLRRGQVAAVKPQRTIVPLGRYAGVFGTMWCVVKEEEGGEALWRGWRLGLWTNVGVLGLGLVGVGVAGREDSEF
ncbi:mitochondrial carrier [Morchella conica CCBAS932]|uniref:Mitochondrial carrier n=1 Tax=Morchella conica CCBAS932 TaxID=1392247 RepID=A0A3N4KF80_9PEZI|nr:mitochondrial carrier [Morchella conica CCBAS932]